MPAGLTWMERAAPQLACVATERRTRRRWTDRLKRRWVSIAPKSPWHPDKGEMIVVFRPPWIWQPIRHRVSVREAGPPLCCWQDLTVTEQLRSREWLDLCGTLPVWQNTHTDTHAKHFSLYSCEDTHWHNAFPNPQNVLTTSKCPHNDGFEPKCGPNNLHPPPPPHTHTHTPPPHTHTHTVIYPHIQTEETLTDSY